MFAALTAAGTESGLVNAGYYTIESMRLEKGYRAYGRELTPEYNPVEAGLLFACKLGTPSRSWAGKRWRRPGRTGRGGGWCRCWPTRLGGGLGLRCCGAASCCSATGCRSGHLTSAAWGEAVGGPVGLGYLRDPDGGVVSRDFVSAGRYQVNVGGALYPATVTLRPPFDPDNTRVRPR